VSPGTTVVGNPARLLAPHNGCHGVEKLHWVEGGRAGAGLRGGAPSEQA
jgi:hypothetical protein